MTRIRRCRPLWIGSISWTSFDDGATNLHTVALKELAPLVVVNKSGGR
jgi:hypothetical protein